MFIDDGCDTAFDMGDTHLFKRQLRSDFFF